MAFWKKKSKQTFRERVDEFWNWFPTVATRYQDLLLDKRGNEVVADAGRKLDKLLPGICWGFGIQNPDQRSVSFNLTGEGQIGKQLLAEYWLSQEVEIPGWTFFGSRQPSTPDSLKDMQIAFGEEQSVDADSFLIRTSVDDEAQKIDIAAWHPTYASLGEEHHLPILFLFLDEALGEFGTDTWLGEIKIDSTVPEGETRLLTELPKFIDSIQQYHHWEKLSPLESYTGYEASEQSSSRRGDTVVGTTCVPNVLMEFLNNNGRLPDDPLPGTGAEFVYIAIDASVFSDGQQVDVRANIEDTIDSALRSQTAGRSLGGAFGINESYIEFLILDGENSRRIIQDTLKELQLGGRSRLETFL